MVQSRFTERVASERWAAHFYLIAALPMAYVAYKGVVPLSVATALAAAFFLRWNLVSKILSNANYLAYLIALFMFVLAIAGIATESFQPNITRVIQLSGIFVVLYCIGILAGAAGPEHLHARGIAVAGGILIAAALFFVMPLLPLGLWTVTESGRFANESPYSAALAVFLVPAAVLVWRYLSKMLAAGILVVASAQILLVDSDVCKLAAVISIGVLLIARLSPFFVLAGFIVSAIIFGLSLMYGCFAGQTVFDVFLHGFINELFGNDISVIHRFYVYDFTNRAICSSPIFGLGVGGILEYPGYDFFIEDIQRYLLPRHPHNGWLHVWVAAGVGGWLAAVALMSGLFYWSAKRQGDPWLRAAMMAGIAAWIVVQQISYSVWSAWWLSFLAIAIAITFYTPQPITINNAK